MARSHADQHKALKYSSPYKIALADEADLSALMSIRIRCFDDIPFERSVNGRDDANTRTRVGLRHLTSWQQHSTTNPNPGMCALKVVKADPITNTRLICGFAEWYIFTKPRTTTPAQVPIHLTDSKSFEDETHQEMARLWFDPVNQMRARMLGNNPCAVLMYMCIDTPYRRQGLSTMCVRWGMDKCTELGIPGWLEASEQGLPVYSALGWEVVGQVSSSDQSFPTLMFWPEGFKETWEAAGW